MDTSVIPVLIVDDDPLIVALLKGLLRHPGEGLACAVTAVGTGAAARVEFARGGYQLVLLDYLLPDEDGLALLAAVNDLPEATRPVVIMLTGGGSEQVAVEAMKLGAKDYMVKTAVNLPALRRAITGALDRRRLEEQLARSTEELRRKNAQLEADLTMAREVQHALLPQSYPVFPGGVASTDSRLRFAHSWLPSHKVAGDFFAVFAVSDTEAGIFLCDVMGHGVRAALITALLHGSLREQQAVASDPGRFLAALNRELQVLVARAGDLVFVTAVYLVVDVTSGAVRLANAGHPAPLHLRQASGAVAPLQAPDGTGPALGLIPEATFDVVNGQLAAGDRLLVFTDGIFEVEGRAGEEFGQARLRQVAGQLLAQPMGQLIEGLLAAVRSYRESPEAGFPDDVCLLAVEFLSPSSE